MVQRDVILIIVDDLSPESYAHYGIGRNTTNRDAIPEHWGNLYDDASFPYGNNGKHGLLTRKDRVTGTDSQTRHGQTYLQCRVAPVCSPTRAQILTGCDVFDTHIGEITKSASPDNVNPITGEGQFNVAPSPLFKTLPKALKEAGYLSGAFGKGHLGLDPPESLFGKTPEVNQDDPNGKAPRIMVDDIGFDIFQGTPRNVASGDPPEFTSGLYKQYLWYDSTDDTLEELTTPHTTEKIFEAAKDWIVERQTAGERFFAYIALNACHTPIVDPASDLSADALMPDPGSPEEHGLGTVAQLNAREVVAGETFNNTRIRAGLGHLDYWLGEFLDGIGENPIIMYVGDNGAQRDFFGTVGFPAVIPTGEPKYPETTGSFTQDLTQLTVSPYLADNYFKSTPREGGIRVPFFFSGDSDLMPGTGGPTGNGTRGAVVDQPIQANDFYATILDLAEYTLTTGLQVPGTGISFLGYANDTAVLQGSGLRNEFYSARYRPNGPRELAENGVEAYGRRDGSGNWWKLSRVFTTSSETFEFHELTEGEFATGTVTIASQPNDGDTVTLDDGFHTAIVYEFTSGAGASGGNIEVIKGGSATDTVTAFVAAVEVSRTAGDLNIGAVADANDADLTHTRKIASGNVTITEVGGVVTVSGMSGGVTNGRLEVNNLGTGHAEYAETLAGYLAYRDKTGSGPQGTAAGEITFAQPVEVQIS